MKSSAKAISAARVAQYPVGVRGRKGSIRASELHLVRRLETANSCHTSNRRLQLSREYKGRCECGKVAFTVNSPRESVTICHCSQCRRLSGHLWAATHALRTNLNFSSDSSLEWYASSDAVKRGFCNVCGSSLFYQKNDEVTIAIAPGCFEESAQFSIGRHIFVANKGDYYDIAEDEPQILKY